MSITKQTALPSVPMLQWGHFWLILACLGAGFFFVDGLDALLTAWQQPEYSHGPLIPVLSLLLFLRQLKEYPPEQGPKQNRWIGVTILLLAVLLGAVGRLANISDIVAYATIIWIGGLLLVGFGWSTGKHFWPPVLHLVYMLPLPGVLYYKLSTNLQFISSEIGVYFLKLLSVPVFLEGNIIDLGAVQLHVAEACSGLRYLFPILSFSYIFAVLYKGPMWHKAVLLISAAPITVLMNSIRIAIGGILVQYLGVEWLEGFTHFFEGWVIFIACILILFLLAWVMLLFHPQKLSVVEALDLETDGLKEQALRIHFVEPSKALIAAALIMVSIAFAWQALPTRTPAPIERNAFVTFPRTLGDWSQVGAAERLTPRVAQTLGADDYHSATFTHSGDLYPVNFFSAWYKDQSQGGVHSPEICLPSAGWEIAWLERVNVSDRFETDMPFNINQAIIQKGQTRMMVYYWFEQKGRKIAWDFAAKMYLVVDGVRTGRTDGAMIRLITEIGNDESNEDAAARLDAMMAEVIDVVPRFIPGY